MRSRFLVLDTSAMEPGIPELSGSKAIVTPGVLEELRRRGTLENVRALLEEGLLEVLEPGEESMRAAARAAAESGDLGRLSRVDLEVLAAAVELSPRGDVHILTDDISIQNVAARLGIEASGSIVGRRKAVSWIYYCPGCGASFRSPPPDLTCPRCGTPLRRKPRSKARGPRAPGGTRGSRAGTRAPLARTPRNT